MAKILFFFSGEGLGHSSRVLSLVEKLGGSHEYFFASYGYAKKFLELFGYEAFDVPSEVKLVGSSGKLDLAGSTLNSFGLISPFNFFRVKKVVDSVKPDLVICDTYISGCFVSKLLGFRVWVIVNHTNIERMFSNIVFLPVSFFAKSTFDFALGFADKVLIPDFSPPNTICINNLEKRVLDRAFFLGPIVRKNFFSNFKKQKKRVFVSIGGFSYREKIFDLVYSASRLLPDYTFDFVLGPNVSNNYSAKNVFSHGSLKYPSALMSRASVVITSGGHSTIMEAISLGKPLLCFPDINHFEQNSNAKRVQELGLGFSLDYFVSPEKLVDLIVFCSKDKGLNANTQKFRKLALSYSTNSPFLKLIDSEFS